MRATVLALAFLAIAVPVADAGKPVATRPDCPDQYTALDAANPKPYRIAVLCLISAVRKSYGMNGFAHDGRLEHAARKWAARQAKTGKVDHGPSVAAIPKRIAKAGYKASAVNEGLGIGLPQDSPYALVDNMMTDFACTEILDPRFRDAGVGASLGRLKGFGQGVHVVVEFGLAAGASQPSHNGKPAKTCGHRLPAATS